MKSIDDALELRGRIFGAFEVAETEPDEVARKACSPSSSSVAADRCGDGRPDRRALPPGAAEQLPDDRPGISPGHPLRGRRPAARPFGKRLSRLTKRDLERLGVEVHTDALVTEMGEDYVVAKLGDGTSWRVESCTKVWAAA